MGGRTAEALILTGAAALLIWAAVDFIQPHHGRRADLATLATADANNASRHDPIPLHRLLPDASHAIGATIRLDGTVAGRAAGYGFWVRDIRDYMVLVEPERGRRSPRDWPDVAVGSVVSVTGVVTLLPTGNGSPAPTGLAPTTLLIREFKIVPLEAGIELLQH